MSTLDKESLIESNKISEKLVTDKDIKISFFEFSRDVLSPKFLDIDDQFEHMEKRFNEVDKRFNLIDIAIATLKTQMYFVLGSLALIGTSLGFIVKMLFDISARLPK
jgi:hypothetical protein